MKQITGVYTALALALLAMDFRFSFFTLSLSVTCAAAGVPSCWMPRRAAHLYAGIEKRGVAASTAVSTVTIVYSGEVEHRDSTGRGGVIGPGDVQWMIAGAGILHEEFHSDAAASSGRMNCREAGLTFHEGYKMTIPGLPVDVIPTVTLPDNAESCAIAGAKRQKARRTLSRRSINLGYASKQRNRQLTLAQPEGWSTALVY